MKIIFLILLVIFGFPIDKCSFEFESKYRSRPEKETFSLSPSGHFMIHYDTLGVAAPNLIDLDENNIPDYVDEVGIIADSTRNVLVNVMGFRPEVDDSDGIYDIYIDQRCNGCYGVNTPDSPNGNGSYITIDNDYSEGYYTSGLLTMRLTVAHEFFHAIQRAYKAPNLNDKFFYELSSTWIEDLIVPDGNDYLYFIDNLFDEPEQSWDNLAGYSLALFGHYLSTQFENLENQKQSTIIRRIWENMGNQNSPYEILNNILEQEYDSSFENAWLDFISINMFNEKFSDMNNDIFYYVDQANELCTAPIVNSIFMESNETKIFNYSLTNTAVTIESIASRDDLAIQLNISQNGSNYLRNFILFNNSDQEYLINSNSEDNLNIPNLYNSDKVQFLYIGNETLLNNVINNNNLNLEVKSSLQYCDNGISENTVVDQCGICGGDNSACTDCNDELNGLAFIDGCGNCVGGSTFLEPCPYDCNNVFGGDAYYDNCGECDENELNDCVVDCLGEWGGLATHDCNGICDGLAYIDGCGDCVGGNTGINSCPDRLVSIYPNPFYVSDTPILQFDISYSVRPNLVIYDLQGNEFVNISLSQLDQGRHELNLATFLPSIMSSGTYFLELKMNNNKFLRKFTFIN